jgi:hypothetical protein
MLTCCKCVYSRLLTLSSFSLSLFPKQETTPFGGQDSKPYPQYYKDIAAGNYPFVARPHPTVDKIQIDHVLSCQVFSAILKKCPEEYSFDRFYSLKTWLNKCWNFIIVPAKVNGSKGRLEKRIKGLINDKCTVR